MSLHDRFGAVIERLASGTSVQRSRRYDRERLERHGDPELMSRIEARVQRLESQNRLLWQKVEAETEKVRS